MPYPAPTTYEIEHLHQPDGWLSPGYLTVSGGNITAVGGSAPRGVPFEKVRGFGVPGMPNLHSHAFQRALAGRTEWVDIDRSSDDLWTWREAMYRLVDGLDPDAYQALAEFAYVQMLKGGFTSVCEFHYLHHGSGGSRYADRAEMSMRLVAAASRAGLGLTLLPTLYLHGGIGRPVAGTQSRFAHSSVAEYLALIDKLRRRLPPHGAATVGVALHSLRAVAPAELAEAVDGATAIDPALRLHIHVSETLREVDEVQAGVGARPVAWLLANTDLDERWTLVHATHLDAAEQAGLAASAAVAGLCPMTEATLGDGIYPLVNHHARGGVWGIGTDSHYSASVAAELRVLECGQRLEHHRRNALAERTSPTRAHSGRQLFDLALAGGARASGRRTAGLVPGAIADLVILDGSAPILLGHGPLTALDAWLLGGDDNPVRQVMVRGQWVVRDGHHPNEEEVARRFVECLPAAASL